MSGFRSSVGLVEHPLGAGDAPLPYLEYLPPGYGDGEPRPLLIALHGFDGGGDGTAASLRNIYETGIPAMIRDDAWPEDRPFVVLMPQHDNNLTAPNADELYSPCDGVAYPGSCVMEIQHGLGNPPDGSLCMTPSELHDFIVWATAAYDVDPDQVFLTGLSCGGFAIYEYAAEYRRTEVAAVVPISADARWAWQTAGCDLGEVPIWAFQGAVDDVVQPVDQLDPLTELGDCPQPPRADVVLTKYLGVDHDAWTATYDLSAGNDVFAWMLDHAR